MRIVILRALGLGDFLTGVPAYRALRRAFPRAHVALAAPAELAPLAELLDGALDEVIAARGLSPLPVQTHRAALAVNLHGKGPQSHRLLLATRPRRTIAFANPAVPQCTGGSHFDPDEHEVTRWCRLLNEAGIAADPHQLDLALPPVTVPPHARGATLIHAGAANEARRWPVERWIEVARSERRLGRGVILTGNDAETARANAIANAAGLPPGSVFAGRTTLGELAALVAGAARVVCGDTGVAHLATAYRRPSVVLFGPTSPALWGPPSRPYHRVLWKGIASHRKGASGNPHGTTLDPALNAIGVEHVIAALDAVS
jgi:ADP-heptose:LPS heptosyltransferase